MSAQALASANMLGMAFILTRTHLCQTNCSKHSFEVKRVGLQLGHWQAKHAFGSTSRYIRT